MSNFSFLDEPTTAVCPYCGQPMQLTAELAGQTVACPSCHAQIVIPASEPPRQAAPVRRPAGKKVSIPVVAAIAVVALVAIYLLMQITGGSAAVSGAMHLGPEHYTSGRNPVAEEYVVAKINKLGFYGKVVHVTSASLDDCLIWSADENYGPEVKAKYPTYYRPTELSGSAVVCITDKYDMKVAMIVGPDGYRFRTLPADCVKLNGGREARRKGRPFTYTLEPDADPLRDNFKRH